MFGLATGIIILIHGYLTRVLAVAADCFRHTSWALLSPNCRRLSMQSPGHPLAALQPPVFSGLCSSLKITWNGKHFEVPGTSTLSPSHHSSSSTVTMWNQIILCCGWGGPLLTAGGLAAILVSLLSPQPRAQAPRPTEALPHSIPRTPLLYHLQK